MPLVTDCHPLGAGVVSGGVRRGRKGPNGLKGGKIGTNCGSAGLSGVGVSEFCWLLKTPRSTGINA